MTLRNVALKWLETDIPATNKRISDGPDGNTRDRD